MAEDYTNAALTTDRGYPIGNDADADGRRKLRVGSSDYALQVDLQSGYLYLGQAAPGSLTSEAKWQIAKITYTSSSVVSQYADGESTFSNVWDNRASLTYV